MPTILKERLEHFKEAFEENPTEINRAEYLRAMQMILLLKQLEKDEHL